MTEKKKITFASEVEALHDRLDDKSPDSATLISLVEIFLPHVGRVRAAELNKNKKISNEERDKVQSLFFNELESEIPKKTPRYREIAIRLDISQDRVRYIIEGPRKKKA